MKKLVFFLLLLCPFPLQAQIARDATAQGPPDGNSGSGPISWTHTTAGTNRFGLVVIAGDLNTGVDDVTAADVTWGGAAVTLVAKNTATLNRFLYLFYIIAPATGSQTIAVASKTHYLLGVSASYTGVAQVSPIDATATNQGGPTILTLTTMLTTTVANDWTILAEDSYDGNAPPAAGTGSNLWISASMYGDPSFFDSMGTVSTGSVSMTTTRTNGSKIAHVMAAIKPNVAGPAGPPAGTLTVLGVGR